MKQKYQRSIYAIVNVLVLISQLGLVSGADDTIDSQTFYVSMDGSKDFTSIQAAINATTAGDEIIVSSGVYSERIVIDKSITLTGSSTDETIIDGENAPVIVSVLASNVTIDHLTMRNGFLNLTNKTVYAAGIAVFADDIIISNCTCTDSYHGILLEKVKTGSITDSLIIDAISGILVNDSENVTLSDCRISFCDSSGLVLQSTKHSMVSSSNISFTDGIGLVLSGSSLNQIHHNTFFNNSYGVRVFQIAGWTCDQNRFYSNNFIDNDISAYDACENSWSSAGVGNYWSDYPGVDTDNDGIGDDSYEIPLIGEDSFPLMNPVDITSENQVNDLVITSPTNNDVVNGKISVAGIAWTKEEVSIESIKLCVDDGEYMNITGTTQWKMMLNTTQYENGNHTILVQADLSNDQMIFDSVTFLIQNEEIISDDTDDTEGDADETPGFSFVAILISGILVLMMLMKRKKK